MLLRSGRLPTSGDYAFEPKWDGFRALVSRTVSYGYGAAAAGT